jgi:quinol-cytochrome oxidoreductase complex cytochrome b subunit
VLIYVGMQEVSDTMVVLGRVCTAYYFLFFLVLMPLLGWFEKTKPLPASISAPVLKQEKA